MEKAVFSTHTNNPVCVKFRDGHGTEVSYKIKRTTMLGKWFYIFCERAGKSLIQLRFFFDGIRLSGEDTPEFVSSLSNDNFVCFRYVRMYNPSIA